MNIIIPAGIVVIALLFYVASYMSPRTDLVLFGVSAILFLTAGVMGMAGFNDYPSTTTITDTVINKTYENETYTQSLNSEIVLKDSTYLDYLPALFVMLGLYQFMVISTTTKGRRE